MLRRPTVYYRVEVWARSIPVKKILLSYGIALAVWVPIALLTVLQQRLSYLHRPFDLPWAISLCARYLAVTALTPPVYWFGRHYAVTYRAARRVVPYLLGLAPFIVVAAALCSLIAPPWSRSLHEFVPRSWNSFLGGIYSYFAFYMWKYLEILLCANAVEYFGRARSEALERAELQEALATSELQALRTQMHPHFLFNMLQGIATLAETDGLRAKAMVVQLSALLRRALEHASSDMAPLREELGFVAEYLDLEHMRLGPRLVVRWSIADETAEALVPSLILLPLVENAVVHGIACARDGGWLEIASSRQEDRLILRVRNSVAPMPARPGTGRGIKNTAARLHFLYAADASVEFEIHEDVAEGIVSMPLLGARDAAAKTRWEELGACEY